MSPSMSWFKKTTTYIHIHTGTRNGISDGEAKRLSLACEMVHNPALIFCEDLTTGLQGGGTATAAECAARVLQKLAYRQRVVICTVRQPTFATFAHFHKVCVGGVGGEVCVGGGRG